jgi:asparagine synthase (glutamine-hydrolysing)
MLDGQGADEILAGYEKFYLPNFKTLLKERLFRAISELIQFFQIHNIGPFASFKAANSFFKKNKKTRPDWLSPSFEIPAEELFTRSADDNVQNTSINLLYEMGLSVLLHYEDRNSLASSVESRLPFLDYRLVEFCLSLPDSFKINKAKRKYILRESMKEILPEAVYKRFDKLGFATPQELWMQQFKTSFDKELKQAIQSCKGIINDKILKSEDIDLVWRVIAFGKWMKVFNMVI